MKMRIRRQCRIDNVDPPLIMKKKTRQTAAKLGESNLFNCSTESEDSGCGFDAFRTPSNWLNKLKAAKGLPLEEDVGIDDFMKRLIDRNNDSAQSSKCDANASISLERIDQCSPGSGESCADDTASIKLDCSIISETRNCSSLSANEFSQMSKLEQSDSFDPSKAHSGSESLLSKMMDDDPKTDFEDDIAVLHQNPSSCDTAENGGKGPSSHGVVDALADFEQWICGYSAPKKHQRKQKKPRICPNAGEQPKGIKGIVMERKQISANSPQASIRSTVSYTSTDHDVDLHNLASIKLSGESSCSDSSKNNVASQESHCDDQRQACVDLGSCQPYEQDKASTISLNVSMDTSADSLKQCPPMVSKKKGLRTRSFIQMKTGACQGVNSLVNISRQKRQMHSTMPLHATEYKQSWRPGNVVHNMATHHRKRQSTTKLKETNVGLSGGLSFPSDHPACQPKDSILFSIYQVFLQAGKTGLTAREAVSKILEQGLPGLHEGGVVPRVEVEKVVRISPYFMDVGDSKFALCSAIVASEDQQNRAAEKVDVNQVVELDTEDGNTKPESTKKMRQKGTSQHWAAAQAIRRARTEKTRKKNVSPQSTLCPAFLKKNPRMDDEASQPRTKRLKSLKQDSAGLGNRCNRSDGKGWHCPLLAQIGYLLCDHHLHKLRLKSGSKAKKLAKHADKVTSKNSLSESNHGKKKNQEKFCMGKKGKSFPPDKAV